MPRHLATIAATTLAAAGVAGIAAAALFIDRGVYDVGAMTQHTQPVYTLLETAMAHSVRRRADGVQTPPLGDRLLLDRGAACYRDHCVQCHAAPGVSPGPVGMSMQPLPGPLQDAARRWKPREIYWITRNGIRMSGMPAWGTRLAERDLWALVAFINTLPEQSPAGYASIQHRVQGNDCHSPSGNAAFDMPTGGESAQKVADDPQVQARILLRQYACVACHRIPGVTGSDTLVGPPLEGIARRRLIAGKLPNTPPNMARWLQEPQAVKPGSAMPDLGVTEAHAQLLAEHLSHLH
jgi:mono/diheme cytochrome c family protein/cytochrome c2